MILRQIIDYKDIKQKLQFISIYGLVCTTETYMMHDKNIQPKQYLLLIFSCETFFHYYCSEAVFM